MNPRLLAAVSIRLAGMALASALAPTAVAQSTAQPPARRDPVGVWRGQSVCLVRPSACHDEIVVYRITPMKAADSVAIDARKIVNGQEEEMGVLSCHVAPSSRQITRAVAMRGRTTPIRTMIRPDRLSLNGSAPAPPTAYPWGV
jgi:hypothetical protein